MLRARSIVSRTERRPMSRLGSSCAKSASSGPAAARTRGDAPPLAVMAFLASERLSAIASRMLSGVALGSGGASATAGLRVTGFGVDLVRRRAGEAVGEDVVVGERREVGNAVGEGERRREVAGDGGARRDVEGLLCVLDCGFGDEGCGRRDIEQNTGDDGDEDDEDEDEGTADSC